MRPLPPEDQPPPPLVAGSEEDAFADMGPPDADSPVAVGAAFLSALDGPAGPHLHNLSLIVTPESWPAWGDFREVASYLADYAMTTRADPAVGDPAVAYVK